MKKSFCFGVAVVCAALSSSVLRGDSVQPGQTAPELKFTTLLQTPPGQKTDPAALKGKVVVLEFWATWCAPCIAEIPHLNQLAKSLQGSPVQFIAVDDEEPKVVEEFLAKKPMSAWVALDSTQSVFKNYGVQARPTTIVIDPNGKIAAVTSPGILRQEQLAALAEGKPAIFPKDEGAAIREEVLNQLKASKDQDATSLLDPLLEITLRPGNPDGKSMISMSGGDGIAYDFKDVTLSMLLDFAAEIPGDRITVHGGDPKARYSMRLAAKYANQHQLAPAVEAAISSALGGKISRVTAEEDVFLLKATGQARSLLTPTASKNESMCFVNPKQGKLMMVKTTAAALASALEKALKTPVVDDTALAGEYDASFDFPKTDVAGASAVLESNLGLTLVKGRRAIERVVVDLPAEPGAAPQSAVQPNQSTPPIDPHTGTTR